MNDSYNEITFDPAYNRHYITVDSENRITFGWSDGPHPNRDTTGAICINNQGGYQFRLIYADCDEPQTTKLPLIHTSEENPPLYTMDGIPMYRWAEEAHIAVKRSKEEIAADRAAIPTPPPTQQEQLRADVDFLAALQGVQL